MIQQLINFIKHCFLMLKSSKSRFILSLMGIVISVVIYLLGSIIIYSISQSSYSQYKDFDRNTLLVSGDIPSEFLKSVELNMPNTISAKYMFPVTFEVSQQQKDNINYIHQTDIIGVSAGFTSLPITDTNAENCVYWTKIIEGRDISREDIHNENRVAVISQYASQVYFGKDNAIGEKIKVSLNNSESDCEYFTVIGIYKNTTFEKKSMAQSLKMVKTNQTDVSVYTDIFVPYSVISENSYQEQKDIVSAVFYLNGEDQNNIIQEISRPYSTSLWINTYESHMKKIAQANANMESMLGVVTIILIALSGLNLMNCMLFSIKERVCEIGIKKAMGAPNYAIAFQFTIETLITSLFGIFFGLIISTILIFILRSSIYNIISGNFNIYISPSIFANCGLLILLQGLVFSVIPALYASKIKVVEALRRD